MKKSLLIIVVIAIAGLLAAPWIMKYFSSSEKGMAGPGGPGGPGGGGVLPVEAVVVKPEPFQRKLIVTGSILPSESIELKPEVSGKITGIFFQESQKVLKGQRLVKINDDELVAQLEKQKYNRKLSQDNEYRQRKLLEKEAISQEEYDNSLNKLKTTEADIKVLEAQISETTIEAPFDGFVGFRFVSPGAYISPSTVIATIYSLDPAKIEFSIPARYATRVGLGSKVIFKQENTDSLKYEGEVYAVEPQIDPQTRTLKIRAKTPNPQGKLIPGQFVSIELILEQLTDAILIPTEAVVPVQDGAKVYLLKQGKAAEAFVTAGERTASSLEILHGLSPGDTVITTGILQLRPGSGIKITKVVNQN
jgi:membrane fusion protein, multidrug efflux system